jgi:hypothetical protein
VVYPSPNAPTVWPPSLPLLGRDQFPGPFINLIAHIVVTRDHGTELRLLLERRVVVAHARADAHGLAVREQLWVEIRRLLVQHEDVTVRSTRRGWAGASIVCDRGCISGRERDCAGLGSGGSQIVLEPYCCVYIRI